MLVALSALIDIDFQVEVTGHFSFLIMHCPGEEKHPIKITTITRVIFEKKIGIENYIAS